MLPIPELMPFRLTRQMRGVLQPHDARDLLRAPLALGLAALRAGSGVLEVRLRVLFFPTQPVSEFLCTVVGTCMKLFPRIPMSLLHNFGVLPA